MLRQDATSLLDRRTPLNLRASVDAFKARNEIKSCLSRKIAKEEEEEEERAKSQHNPRPRFIEAERGGLPLRSY